MKIRLIRKDGPWSESRTGKGKFIARLIPCLRELGAEIVCDINSDVDIDMQLGHVHYTPKYCKKFVIRMGPAFVDANQKWKKLNRPKTEAIQKADAVIYQSKFAKNMCDTFLGQAKGKTTIIYNGAERTDCAPLKSKTSINFCSATRDWIPQKRLIDIIKSWLDAELKNARLWIAGDTRGLEKKYSHKSLYFMGNIDNRTLNPLFQLCTTMIHVVYIDACPNVVCEAMVHGCQVLTNNNGGTQELIDEYGRNGRVLNIDTTMYNFTPIDLKHPQKINRKLLTETIRAYSDIPKHNCYDRVNIENTAKQYMTFFEEVLNG